MSVEQLDYNLLFRWFVGLSAVDPVWDATRPFGFIGIVENKHTNTKKIEPQVDAA
jgi:hypothetical protein